MKRIRPAQKRGPRGYRYLLPGLNLPISRCITAFAILLFAAGAHAQLFQITSATYGTATSIPAGINGVVLELGGTLPTAGQESDSGYQGCFYTGTTTAAFPLTVPDSANTEPLTVPASAIQAIPQSQFTATNGYAVTASIYFVGPEQVCDGEINSDITNTFPISVVAPSLGAYSGPVAVPRTNSVTGIQAAPLTLAIPASGTLPSTSPLGSTTVKFGTIATATPLATSSTSTLFVRFRPRSRPLRRGRPQL